MNSLPTNINAMNTTVNTKVTELVNDINTLKTAIEGPMTIIRDNMSRFTNVNTNVNELTRKMDKLQELKGTLDSLGTDLSTAYTREAVVSTKDEAISYQQAWGMIQRPIRRQSIPLLIIFTLLFLTAAGLGIWYLSPFASAVQLDSSSLLQTPYVYFGTVGLMISVVIYGILAILRLI